MKYTIIVLSLFLVGCGGKYSDEDITLLSCEYENSTDEFEVTGAKVAGDGRPVILTDSSNNFSLLINKTRKLAAFVDTRSLVEGVEWQPGMERGADGLVRLSEEKAYSWTAIYNDYAFLNEGIEKTAWSAKEITPYASDSFNKEVIEWKEQIKGGGDITVSNRLYTNTLTLYSEYYVNVSNQVRAKYNCVKLDKEIEHMPDWELGEQNRL